jgi:hypothetical protein
LVLVPYVVPPANLSEAVEDRLNQHRFEMDDPRRAGRFDRLVGAIAKSLNDPIAEGRLPKNVRRAWSGNICDKARVPPDLVPGALVTIDGAWHDLSDFGWRMVDEPSAVNDEALARWGACYRQLLAAAPDCWVLEVWAHS